MCWRICVRQWSSWVCRITGDQDHPPRVTCRPCLNTLPPPPSVFDSSGRSFRLLPTWGGVWPSRGSAGRDREGSSHLRGGASRSSTEWRAVSLRESGPLGSVLPGEGWVHRCVTTRRVDAHREGSWPRAGVGRASAGDLPHSRHGVREVPRQDRSSGAWASRRRAGGSHHGGRTHARQLSRDRRGAATGPAPRRASSDSASASSESPDSRKWQ